MTREISGLLITFRYLKKMPDDVAHLRKLTNHVLLRVVPNKDSWYLAAPSRVIDGLQENMVNNTKEYRGKDYNVNFIRYDIDTRKNTIDIYNLNNPKHIYHTTLESVADDDVAKSMMEHNLEYLVSQVNWFILLELGREKGWGEIYGN